MSNPPVMSITDELVAELEFDLEVAETTHQLEASVSREALAALLAERAELLRDAKRWRWLRLADWWSSPICAVKDPKSQAKPGTDCPTRDRLDAAIDAAMQSEAKP